MPYALDFCPERQSDVSMHSFFLPLVLRKLSLAICVVGLNIHAVGGGPPGDKHKRAFEFATKTADQARKLAAEFGAKAADEVFAEIDKRKSHRQQQQQRPQPRARPALSNSEQHGAKSAGRRRRQTRTKAEVQQPGQGLGDVREFLGTTCNLGADLSIAMSAFEAMGVRALEDFKLLGGGVLEVELEKLGMRLVLRKRLRDCIDQHLQEPPTWWGTLRRFSALALEDRNLKIMSGLFVVIAPFLPAQVRRVLRRDVRPRED